MYVLEKFILSIDVSTDQVVHLSFNGIQPYYPRVLYNIYLSEDFDRLASPKMISDCHMLRMNVCNAGRQARRHAETRKRVDIYKSVIVSCARLR